ncbi:ABC transporter ATP-binding protein [Methylicorpusculum oleiharenae]|uniref:ABC transporter ATP-binding protein n=1 Tax=Methylicorpusculum oleiharenae TaxID=1338687 RepID=UPI0013583E8B|nr:ABC transporter ATP-binding protein [Methylicorpusculum oleiharenae]MCD2451818.1 ABC transporter ATP-binding protein [Methylicorpusculum oleiharenae]
MPIIEVNHLTKEYQLGHLTSLKETALNALRHLTFRPVQERERFKALDDVNFFIEEGEVVGIIGHNGAGKSTLLKHLANISKPTAGKVIVRGSIAPLIEVGAGVNPELSGRENIFLNGAILGIPKKIIQQKLDEIIEFSELEQFIDTPVKRYSSGMTVKLGFSIATSMDADILIIDEVLSVGDLAFQRKCFDRMERLIKKQGKTVLIVSHNIRQMERICERLIWLDHGRIMSDGSPSTIVNEFICKSNEQIKTQASKRAICHQKPDELTNIKTALFDEIGNEVEKIRCLSSCRFQVTFKTTIFLKNITFYFGIHSTDFVYITANNTAYNAVNIEPGEHKVELNIERLTLLPGSFSFLVWIGNSEGFAYYHEEGIHPFVIYSEEYEITRQSERGLLYLNGTWKLDNHFIVKEL